jgi:NADPH:quinone reductase-like Zn-dependent oxidoreductase
MPSNRAAWINAKLAKPLEIKSSFYPSSIDADELVVKNGAVAINPMDWLIQDMGNLVLTWLKYPAIIGADLAGEVVSVGSDVEGQFQVGDRVLALAVGTDPDCNNPSQGAFQQYTVVKAALASRIPSSLDYPHAAVLPLGVATAASALFQKDYLGLQLPTVPARQSTGETVLVWGGSSSVGSNAIQLAVAAGYEVFATASPRNFGYLKKLGARQVFDYNSSTVVKTLVAALEHRIVAGAVAVGPGSLLPCIDIVGRSKGKRFVTDIAGPPVPKSKPTGLKLVQLIFAFVSWAISVWLKCTWSRVRTKFVYGSDLKKNEVGPHIFGSYLPDALKQGHFNIAPTPEVVGNGLEYIQDGFNLLKEGVSAKKLVVLL